MSRALSRVLSVICFGFLFTGRLPGVVLPVLAVQEMEISDVPACARFVASVNESMRAKHGVPLFVRSYAMGGLEGGETRGFVLRPAVSFEALHEAEAAYASDPDLAAGRESFRRLGQTGSVTYLKAVRFDGTREC